MEFKYRQITAGTPWQDCKVGARRSRVYIECYSARRYRWYWTPDQRVCHYRFLGNNERCEREIRPAAERFPFFLKKIYFSLILFFSFPIFLFWNLGTLTHPHPNPRAHTRTYRPNVLTVAKVVPLAPSLTLLFHCYVKNVLDRRS